MSELTGIIKLSEVKKIFISEGLPEEFSEELCQLIVTVQTQRDQIEKLKAENEKMRECLGFYADATNWAQAIDGKYNLGKIWVNTDYEGYPTIGLECGERARKTLAEIKEMK